MTTVSHGKPYAGNPHVRFEEGASESAKPSRNALLHNKTIRNLAIAALFIFPGLSGFPQEVQQAASPAAPISAQAAQAQAEQLRAQAAQLQA